MALKLILSVLLAIAVSEAHLKLFYEPWKLPIRNAPGSTSDGTYSASANDPCGGEERWGRQRQRRWGKVVDGQTICARANWNGGHFFTESTNWLAAIFTCNEPDRKERFENLPELELSNMSNPKPTRVGRFIDAPETNARYEGYTVCLKLPYQGITTSMDENNRARRCTMAVIEGNRWGNCMDLMLYPNADNGGDFPIHEPALLPSPEEFEARKAAKLSLVNSAGTYRITNCFSDTGGKCCLTGYFGVREDGAVSGRFYGNSGFGSCYDLAWGFRDYQMILRPSYYGEDLYTANFYLYMGWDEYGRPVTTQNMSMILREGGTMTISNVGLDIPEVSDHDAVYFSSLQTGMELHHIPYPLYTESQEIFPWGLVIGGGVCVLLILYLILGTVCNRCCGGASCCSGPCRHPHVHWCLIKAGCIHGRSRTSRKDGGGNGDAENAALLKSKKVYTIALPPNWESAVDHTSGEVYYYNKVTKVTQWERPMA